MLTHFSSSIFFFSFLKSSLFHLLFLFMFMIKMFTSLPSPEEVVKQTLNLRDDLALYLDAAIGMWQALDAVSSRQDFMG